MKLFVGLGNPGIDYQKTRHNVGFMVVDLLQQKWKFPDFSFHKKFQADWSKSDKQVLLKPQTYMNNSGQAVRALLDFFSVSPAVLAEQSEDQLFVIHDDLDLKLGSFKIQFGKGPKVHNGLESLYQHLGTKDFWHVRVGVDDRQGDRSMPGRNYVLQPFTEDQRVVITKVIDQIATELQHALF